MAVIVPMYFKTTNKPTNIPPTFRERTCNALLSMMERAGGESKIGPVLCPKHTDWFENCSFRLKRLSLGLSTRLKLHACLRYTEA